MQRLVHLRYGHTIDVWLITLVENCLDGAAILKTYTERCRKFLDYLKSKADASTGFPDVKLSTDWHPGLATSGPSAFKRVGHRSVKMLAHWATEPTQTYTQNWLIAKVDTELLATQCYHVEVQWLACMGSLVDEAITGSARRAKQLGLEFMQVSENGVSSNLDLHPFIAPIFLPIANPEEQQSVERALVERFGFCCEGLHPIPFTHLNHEREYSIAAPEPPASGPGSKARRIPRRVVAYYRQYAHRSLSCFARMTQTGLVWISNQKTHDDEIQPVFDQLKGYIEAIRAARVGLSGIIDDAVDLAIQLEKSSLSSRPTSSVGVEVARSAQQQRGSDVDLDAPVVTATTLPPSKEIDAAGGGEPNTPESSSLAESTATGDDDKENELRMLNGHVSSPVGTLEATGIDQPTANMVREKASANSGPEGFDERGAKVDGEGRDDVRLDHEVGVAIAADELAAADRP